MKKNFDTILTNIAGIAILNGSAPKREDGSQPELTMKDVVLEALLQPLRIQDEPDRKSAQSKLSYNFELSLKIQKGGEVEISPEDVVAIKERIFLAFPDPVIYGRVSEFLNA